MSESSEAVRPRRWRKWGILAAGLVAASAAVLVTVVRQAGAGAATPVQRETPAAGVACLGHIEPDGGVTVLAARSLTGQPSILSELLVKEGDPVRAGQVVAILNSRAQLEAAWREAVSRINLAKAQLAQVEAGARAGDVVAQQAEIARLEAELANAQTEYQRFASLSESQTVSRSELDLRQTRFDTARQLVAEAKGRLHSLTEVRATDVDAARAAIAAAVAAEQRARAELEPSIVRAPFDGRVLKVFGHVGEDVGPRGILELGRTDVMVVIAEVAEGDVGRVKVGDPAIVTANALDTPLAGVVEQIGSRVTPGQILNTDPAAFVDARIVEVKIRLHDSRRAERLVHAQVHVLIGR